MKDKNYEWLKSALFLIGLVVVLVAVRLFIFTPVVVKGDSMDPTLQDGERVIALLNTKVKRFDIVTFPAPDEPDKYYIKRVIGLPGDTVSYQNDQLLINGKKVAEPYLNEYKKDLTDGMPLTLSPNQEASFKFEKVPVGKILVLGDNRRISKDTRSIGFIDEKTVSGDVKFVFWPLKEIGFINK
ncbi:signal peptidase I [Enterococcus canintestini]|uniref:signal peptidase I n=1 Tax=Enterococcus canintestini TaxID=317010 RepID=UPI00288D57FA|nr:signal peptidase I [Enterococcus canintestini]MDT2740601.1 signal peptidase I [Enterococcus canintestini]